MFALLGKTRCSPIAVDVGSQSVKLLQLSADRTSVHEAVRWEIALAQSADAALRDRQVAESIRAAMAGRRFRGRDAVFCIGPEQLFVQNIRVPVAAGADLNRLVRTEAAGRLPFSSEEAELRFLPAAEVRQGDSLRREVIVLACHRPVLQRMLEVAEQANLRPIAIDVEPTALLRCYAKQFRRDEDRQRRLMFVSIGASTTRVIIARGAEVLFIKYVDFGGRQLDEAVAHHLEMPLGEAAALRRHNGDRRADQRDPEVARSIHEACRPALDRLANELALCVRYYSVTFRGQPLAQIVLGGGEAQQSIADWLSSHLGLPCELGNPLRCCRQAALPGRVGQWDVAVGLALKELN